MPGLTATPPEATRPGAWCSLLLRRSFGNVSFIMLMCVYIYICMYMYAYTHVYTYTYVHIHIYVYIFMYTSIQMSGMCTIYICPSVFLCSICTSIDPPIHLLIHPLSIHPSISLSLSPSLCLHADNGSWFL